MYFFHDARSENTLDKSVVVFQSFGNKELKEEQTFVNNVMAEVDGFMMVSRMSISVKNCRRRF